MIPSCVQAGSADEIRPLARARGARRTAARWCSVAAACVAGSTLFPPRPRPTRVPAAGSPVPAILLPLCGVYLSGPSGEFSSRGNDPDGRGLPTRRQASRRPRCCALGAGVSPSVKSSGQQHEELKRRGGGSYDSASDRVPTAAMRRRGRTVE